MLAVARYMLTSSYVCVSVTRRYYIKTAKLGFTTTAPYTIAQGLYFSDTKDFGKIKMGSPQTTV